MSEEKAHALLGASGAKKWMTCTPSARLEETFPDSSSDYAREGTLAHELAELKVRKHFLEPIGQRKFNSMLKVIKENQLYQPEMDEHTETYLEYIKKIAYAYTSRPYIAIEKKLDYSKYAPEGFGTADCIIIAENDMYVIDFKYGQGHPVYAEENEQMKLYAVGAYLEYSILYDVQNIHLSIVQPRKDNISEFTTTPEKLMIWAEETVKPLALLAWEGKGEFVPGEHCNSGFCRARKVCRARSDMNIALAGFIDKKPPLITNQEVGEYLEKAQDIVKWVKDLEDYALSECLSGREVSGWKSVEGRGSREFTDLDAAFNKLKESGIDEAILYERKPLTLAQAEKVVGKKEFNDLVGDLVIKNPGKPTLVKESDKRPAISNMVTASDIFKTQSKEEI